MITDPQGGRDDGIELKNISDHMISLAGGRSHGRCPDGTGPMHVSPTPTPLGPNAAPMVAEGS